MHADFFAFDFARKRLVETSGSQVCSDGFIFSLFVLYSADKWSDEAKTGMSMVTQMVPGLPKVWNISHLIGVITDEGKAP